MSYKVPYFRETFIPKTIEGNDTTAAPVSFELLTASSMDRVRLKSILFATGGLSGWIEGTKGWGEEVQAAVAESFKNGPMLFVNCVGRIRNLTTSVDLAKRVGVRVPDHATDEDEIPITNGADFAKVAPFMISLALELAFEIQRLSTHGPAEPPVVETAH